MNALLASLICRTGLRYGILFGIVSAALFFTFAFLQLKTNGLIFVLLSLIFTVVFIFLAHLFFKENNGGTMTFGQGVSISFLIGLVSGSISSTVVFIYVKFINTAYAAGILEQMRTELEKNGLPDEQIDKLLDLAKMTTTPTAMFFSGFFGAIIGALVIGLLVSIFTKKKLDTPF